MLESLGRPHVSRNTEKKPQKKGEKNEKSGFCSTAQLRTAHLTPEMGSTRKITIDSGFESIFFNRLLRISRAYGIWRVHFWKETPPFTSWQPEIM